MADDSAEVLREIRAGFLELMHRVEQYDQKYVARREYDLFFNLLDLRTKSNIDKLNNLELRLEELASFKEQIKANTDNVSRLEKRMDNAPGKNAQAVSLAIAVISVLIAIASHVKIG